MMLLIKRRFISFQNTIPRFLRNK